MHLGGHLQLQLNETTAARRRMPLRLVDATDGFTGETGKTISAGDVKVSKNGAAEGNHAGTLTELAGGDYYYEASAGEVDTVGYLTARFTVSGCRVEKLVAQVVAFDPYDSGLARAADCIAIFTVDTGASTTSIPTSSLDPAAAVTDQFKNATVVFAKSTTTAALRGQRSRITASSTGGTLTVSPALATTPASGDVGVIV